MDTGINEWRGGHNVRTEKDAGLALMGNMSFTLCGWMSWIEKPYQSKIPSPSTLNARRKRLDLKWRNTWVLK